MPRPLLFASLWILLLPMPAASPQPPGAVSQYKVRVEVRDGKGRFVPAQVVISANKVRFAQQKSQTNGLLTLNLRSGDTYQFEALLDGYQPVRKVIRLDRIAPDAANPNVLLVLEMQPKKVPVAIAVVDDKTGKPIVSGYYLKVEDGTEQFSENTFQPESKATLLAYPGQPVRVVVKAEGYATQTQEIPDNRFIEETVIRLRPLEDWAIRPYSVRVIDSDYQHVLTQYDLQIRDELLQPVPLRQDSYTNDWQVLLKQKVNYTIEVQAPGYVPYRDTVRAPPQMTILVVLHRQPKPGDVRATSTLAALNLNGRGKPAEPSRPAYYLDWVQKVEALRKGGAQAAGREAQALLTLDRIFFDQSSSNLRPESLEQLTQLADLLKQFPTLKVKITGHTDRVGDRKMNLFLSDNRAGEVFNYLIDKGIDATRMRFQGYGHSRPAAPSDTEENRQKNRRVEVWVVEK
jgi:outer membrane protein OmpA-like peptidoglycan-associated protein